MGKNDPNYQLVQQIDQEKVLTHCHPTLQSKIDGLGEKKDGKQVVLLIEFADGTTATKSKLESDIKKIYRNAVKAIKDQSIDSIFTIINLSIVSNQAFDQVQISNDDKLLYRV